MHQIMLLAPQLVIRIVIPAYRNILTGQATLAFFS